MLEQQRSLESARLGPPTGSSSSIITVHHRRPFPARWPRPAARESSSKGEDFFPLPHTFSSTFSKLDHHRGWDTTFNDTTTTTTPNPIQRAEQLRRPRWRAATAAEVVAAERADRLGTRREKGRRMRDGRSHAEGKDRLSMASPMGGLWRSSR